VAKELTVEQKRQANVRALPVITDDNNKKETSLHWALKLWCKDNLKGDVYAGFAAGIAYLVFAETHGRKNKHPEMTDVGITDEKFEELVDRLLAKTPDNFKAKYRELLGLQVSSTEEDMDRHDIMGAPNE